MITTKTKAHDIIENDFLTIQSKVNKTKLAKLYGLLSNIYRNPIGAIVREYASNAYDANIEARNFANLTYEQIQAKYKWTSEPQFNLDRVNFDKLKKSLVRVAETEPVIVGFVEQNNEIYFYIKDYGIGLSPERMRHIYFNYLDSTKEDTNDEIGAFGIGSKSALSYSHTFFIDTTYGGITYNYIMSKNADGIPQGQLLFKSDYDESLENGTMIKVKLKDTNHISIYLDEVKRQLAYMDNLFIDTKYLEGGGSRYLGYYERQALSKINDFKIYKGDKWIKRDEGQPVGELHMSLGKIVYTIDWTELGMSSINEPLALEFNIGELQPTPSRESILYTSHSIKVIKDKIKEVQDLFIDKYITLREDTNDFDHFLKHRDENSDKISIGDDIEIDLSNLLGDAKYNSIKLLNKMQFIPFMKIGLEGKHLPSYNSHFFSAFSYEKYVSSKTARVAYLTNSSSIPALGYNLNKHYQLDEGGYKFTYYRNAHFYDKVTTFKNDNLLIFKEKKDYNYKSHLGLIDGILGVNKKLNDKKIKVYRDTILNYLRKNSQKYQDHEPNPNWYHTYNAGKSIYSPKVKLTRPKGKITCLVNSEWTHGTFNRMEVELSEIPDLKGVVLCAGTDERDKAQYIGEMLRPAKNLRSKRSEFKNRKLTVLILSKNNLKIVKGMDNTITVKEMIKNKTFQRVVTAYKIVQIFKKISYIENMIGANSKVDKVYKGLEKYIRAYTQLGRYQDGEYIPQIFIDDMIATAEKAGVINKKIIKQLEYLIDYAEGLEIFKSFKNRSESENIEPIVEFLKSKGKIVDDKFNKKPIKDDKTS